MPCSDKQAQTLRGIKAKLLQRNSGMQWEQYGLKYSNPLNNEFGANHYSQKIKTAGKLVSL